MTVATDGRSGTGLRPGTRSGGRRDRGTPVRIVRIYAILLVLIPPTHIIGPLGGVGTPATVFGLVALMLWGVAVLTPGGDYLCRTVVAVRVVMGVLVGTILVSYAVLHLRHVPGGELLGSDRMLLQVLSWAGVGLLAAEGLRDRSELYRVLRTLVMAVAVMAVVGFLQFRSGIDLAELADRIPVLHENAERVSIQDREGFRRPAGTATHPIEFGTVIAMALPLALHLARFDVARSRIRRWLPVAAIAIGIPVAVSRSAVLAALVAAVVIFAGMDPKLRPRALGVAAAFIVAIYATTPGLLGTLRNLFVHAGSDSSISYRTTDYEVVGEYIRESPLLGRGPGTFLADRYVILDNQYLLSAIEIGLVGLLTVIGYLLASAFLGRGARHRSRDPAIRDLGQAMAATSLAGAVAAFTFDAFSFLMYAGFVPLCLGVAGSLWSMQRAAELRTGAERPLGATWGPPSEAPRDAVPDAPACGRPTEDGLSLVLDVDPPAGAALNYDGGDVRQRGREPFADDEELQWLTTSDAEPFGRPSSSTDRPGRGSAADAGDDAHESRRVVGAVGAGIGVVLLAGLAVAVARGGGDRPDTAAVQTVTTTTVTPTSRPTTTSVRPTTTTSAQRPSATTTRPVMGDTTATSRTAATNGSGSSATRSSASPPAASPPAAPSPSTTADTVPPTTTTVPPTTTTVATTTTTVATTTTVQPTATATTRPGNGPTSRS